MMQELGLVVSAAAAAERYGDLLSGYMVDTADVAAARGTGHPRQGGADADDRSRHAPGIGASRSRLRRRVVTLAADIWAVVPIKELDGAKQRLSPLLSPAERRALIEVMMGEVLEAVAGARSLAGILVVTVDPQARALAERLGARIVMDGAREGHTGSVTAGLRMLAREGRGGMITLPADIPATTPQEIDLVVAAHLPAPSFTISPAHDDLGSNAVVCSPPDAVPLRFGDNSYFPHLDAARAHGIEPTVIRQPGIAMDIDHPVDLAAFLRLPRSAGARTRAFLEEAGIAKLLADHGL